jgi:FtsZ-binding cell division protein ZapB
MDTITLQIEIDQLRSENQHLKDYIHHLHELINKKDKIEIRDVDCSREYPDFNITCEDDLYKVVEIKK